MNALAIDTCGEHLGVLIIKDGKPFYHFEKDCGVKHSVSLMPAVESLVKECGFDFKTADFFACAIGPGSFTGIRIGVATVKALCLAFNKPCLPVTSFDILAYNKKSGKYLATVSAGHGNYYICGYKDGEMVLPPQFADKEKVKELSEGYEIISDGELPDFKSESVPVKEGLFFAVHKLAQSKVTPAENLTPLYLRKSQAEEGRCN